MTLLNAEQLATALEIPLARVQKWKEQGLPFDAEGQIEEQVAIAWITAKKMKKAGVTAEVVATTVGDAARLLGCGERSIHNWARQEGFPGTIGQAGMANSYLPIEKIKAWREGRGEPGGGEESGEMADLRKQKIRLEIDSRQIHVERELGTLLDADQAAGLMERQIATARALLDQLPDKIDTRLPGTTPPAVRKRIRKAVEQSIRDTYGALAEMKSGDTDSTEDVEE